MFFIVYIIGLAAVGFRPSVLSTTGLFFCWGIIWRFVNKIKPPKINGKDLTIKPTDERPISQSINIQSIYLDPEFVNSLAANLNKTKNQLFRASINTGIVNLLENNIKDKNQLLRLIDIYHTDFNKNIVDELKGLSSSYATIKLYLKPLINFGVVEKEWPHKLII